MKALVPGGYMVAAQGKTLTVAICGDSTLGQLTLQVTIPMKSDPAPGQAGHAKDSACAYSALSLAALGGADAVLLALALAFVLALGFLAVAPTPIHRAAHLRPPLRGPPALA